MVQKLLEKLQYGIEVVTEEFLNSNTKHCPYDILNIYAHEKRYTKV